MTAAVNVDAKPRTPLLAYSEYGSGPTLVLIHGLSHRRHAWDPVIELLAPHRRVITVDLPGHGDSPLTEADDLVAQAIAELAQFVDDVAEPGELPHVAGNSLGGWAALELAARGRVKSATALSPVGFARNRLDHKRSLAMFTGLRSALRLIGADTAEKALRITPARALMLSAFYSRPWKADAAASAIDARALLENQVIDRAPDHVPTFSPLARPETPITVAWGTNDLILPIYQAPLVRRTFPDAKLTVLPGLGHVPMGDDPRRIADVLLAGSA